MAPMFLMFKALEPGKKAPKAAPAKDTPKPEDDLANPNFVGLLSLLKKHGAGGAFGKHNVAEGDDVSFNAGEFCGKGCVTSAGEHGATVEDSTAREHRVHWHEITGHKPAKKGKGKDE